MDFYSIDDRGFPCNFISFIIIAHGEDLREQPTPQDLQGKLHKLMLGGISGNVTDGSVVLDALFYNAARIQAHDRSISHVEKLYRVRDEVFRYPYIGYEIEKQHAGQKKFVADSMAKGMYQRVVDSAGWIPKPSTVEYNRRYSFNANPWSDDSTIKSHKDVMESREFGIWAVDASIGIANQIGLKPGINPNVVSLMPLLRLVQTSARASPTPYAPDRSASNTTLFDLVRILQKIFGVDTYVSVIDLCCRFYNWDDKKPDARRAHAELKRSRDIVDKFITPLSERLGSQAHSFLSWGWGSDEEPPPAVGLDTVPRIIDYVKYRDDALPLKEVVYWERNGHMKYSDSTDSAAEFESDVKYNIARGHYGLGDRLPIDGRDLTIFYILENGACFFCHETVDDTERTVYLTPVGHGLSKFMFEITDNLTEKLENKGRKSIKPFNVSNFGDIEPSQQRSLMDTPPPFLPPYGYPTSRMGSFRIGGRRTRQMTRLRMTKHKKYKRRHAKNRKKTRRSNK